MYSLRKARLVREPRGQQEATQARPSTTGTRTQMRQRTAHQSYHKAAIKEGLKANKSISSSWRSKPERRAVRFYDAPAHPALIPPEPIGEGRSGK